MNYVLSLLSFLLLFCLVHADQVNLVKPKDDAIYHTNETINIDYNIQSMGMSKIWNTHVSLINVDKNQTIQEFPSLYYHDGNNKEIQGTWTITNDVTSGTYSLLITANTTYHCSTSGEIRPFKQCQSVVYKRSTFTILK